MKTKLEHIDNLARGKKSGAKIGSRGVPHHLYTYEQIKYERAMKKRYLEVTSKDRVNLRNLWEKVCQVQGWKNYVLIKKQTESVADILLDEEIIYSGELKEMKIKIQSLCSE